MFKDLKQGNAIYVLKTNAETGEPTYYEGSITKINLPQPNTLGSSMNYPFNPSYVKSVMGFNVNIDSNGDKIFDMVNPETDYFTSGAYTVSTSKEKINQDVKNILSGARMHINKMDLYKKVAAKASSVLQEIGLVNNITETDKRIANLEDTVLSMNDNIKALADKLLNNNTEVKAD